MCIIFEHFIALKRRVKKPSSKDRTTSAQWISDTTCNLSDQKLLLGMKCIANQGEHRTLTRKFQEALKEDRRFKLGGVGDQIEALLSKDQLIEVWSKTQRWYREAKRNQYLPTREQLD